MKLGSWKVGEAEKNREFTEVRKNAMEVENCREPGKFPKDAKCPNVWKFSENEKLSKVKEICGNSEKTKFGKIFKDLEIYKSFEI